MIRADVTFARAVFERFFFCEAAFALILLSEQFTSALLSTEPLVNNCCDMNGLFSCVLSLFELGSR